jgi:hypothetical protein
VKADFSRMTFAGDKHYRRVLMQQGRVEIDADVNEQIAIDAHLSELTNTDVIGAAGYPVGTDASGDPIGGFALTLTPDKKDIDISVGRMYVDGILVENSTPNATLLSQPGLPDTSLAGVGGSDPGIYLAYLKVWERVVTALDDPAIREAALGGPDTSVRSIVVWQVRLARVGDVPPDPAQLPACSGVDLSILPAAPTGTLTASTGGPSDPMPCMLPPESGYLRLENQLYRVEVHIPGADGTATFKWSRENGSVVALIVAPSGSGSAPTTVTGPTFTVNGLTDDPTLGLKPGDWVEFVDDAVELSGRPGQLYQVTTPPSDGHTVTINGSPTATLALHPKLRRWDMTGAAYAQGVPLTSGAPIPLEAGLQVKFSAGTYRTGDYWLIPARTATSIEKGHIEWPDDGGSPPNPLALPPAGINLHFAKLGLVELASDQTFSGLGSAAEPTDCRLPFWPLTQLNPSERTGPCTIVVQPGPGWEVPVLNWFRLAAENKRPLDAEICFPVGEFPTADVVRIQNAGHVRLNGGGWGTKLTATGSAETVIEFNNCASVGVRDLYASVSTVTGLDQDTGGNGRINGTLSFYNCSQVTVEQVWARCGSAISRRGAACITIASDVTTENASTGSGTATVRDCLLHPGEMQVGLQLIHLERAAVEDNEIDIDPAAPLTTLRNRLEDPGYLAIARSHLLSNVGDTETIKAFAPPPPAEPAPPPPAEPAPPPPAEPAPAKEGTVARDVLAASPATLAKTPAVLQVGNQTLSALTDRDLVSTWQTYLENNAPKTFATQADASNYLKRAANLILTDATARQGFSAFAAVLRSLSQHVPLAGRGISYGGQGLGRLSITGNVISGVLLGISVGVSHKASAAEAQADQRTPDHMGNVHIAANSVACQANDLASKQARFGIFVGNAESVEIEDNRLGIQPAGLTGMLPADGIRVVGYLGRRMIIRGNYTSGFPLGIRVMPLVGNGPGQRAKPMIDVPYTRGLREGSSLWLVADNVVAGGRQRAMPGPFEPTKNPTAGPTPFIDAWACLLVDNVATP